MMLNGEDVVVRAGRRRLLDRVSVEVVPGRVLAVLGPNGAGKSTLLKTLSGDLIPSSGTVRMNGRTLSEWGMHERARLRGVLAQESKLSFGFTVLEVVLMGRLPYEGRNRRLSNNEIARAALAAVDAARLESRIYTTLSGGERQRVHLARILAQLWDAPRDSPRYLLLDEPTSSLDPSHQHGTLRIARDCARDGLGVMVVLHDLNLAAQYADRLMILKEGKCFATGRPDEVLRPSVIRKAFELQSIVLPHPTAGWPLVIPCSEPKADDDLPFATSTMPVDDVEETRSA